MNKYAERAIAFGKQQYRLWTGGMRLLPDFVIVGAQKGGTTFLYDLLVKHPFVKSAKLKEIHYFDEHFARGLWWYRSHFPLQIDRYVARQKQQTFITGEASPYYMLHPHSLRRMADIIPHAQLIVLLRNPVDRAYSHYHHQVRKKRETLAFEDAIAAEASRLQGELEKMLEDESYFSFNHRHFTYLERGKYIEQLQSLEQFFDKRQILILKSEDLYGNTILSLKKVLDFLNLPEWTPKKLKALNVGRYSNLERETRDKLQAYFAPYNQKLYEYLGCDLGWEKQ